MSPRPYRLGRREASVQATRRRILDAGARLVEEGMFHQVSVDGIASEAGVARATVYYHFGSREGLIRAVTLDIRARGEIEGHRTARQLPDPVEAMHEFVRERTRFLSRVSAPLRFALAQAVTDPDWRTVMDETYWGARPEAIRELVGRLVEAGTLDPAWPPSRAVDVLLVVTSMEAYDTLVLHAGLSVADAGEVLVRMAANLLAPGAREPVGGD